MHSATLWISRGGGETPVTKPPRQDRPDEAREPALEAAAKLPRLPAGGANADDRLLWLG